MSNQIDAEIVSLRLRKLFDPGGFFSISCFDELCELCNAIPKHGIRERLRALHCVSYRDMSESMREWLFAAVIDALGTPGFPTTAPVEINVRIEAPEAVDVEVEPEAKVRRGFLGLFGGSR